MSVAGTNTVTVVIPTHKRPEMLRALLDSLSRQRTSRRFEVVVVDDGSGGDLGALEVEFSDITLKVIRLPHSRGRAFARNEGVRRSVGGTLIFVDDDMTVVEEFVEAHVAAHTGDDVVAIGDVLTAPEHRRDPLARYVEQQGVRRLRNKAEIPPKCVRTGNLSMSRAMFGKIGMFDEAIARYGEDMDLGMKLYYGGARFVFAERAISYHHHPPDIDDVIAKMEEYGRYTVPLLVAQHPEIARVIRVHVTQPIRWFRDRPAVLAQKVAFRIGMTPPVYGLARWLYRRQWLGDLLFPVIDYLRAYTYIRAYAETSRDRGAQGDKRRT
ncbi:MAG: glycosyltransferase [bacterium]